MFAFKKQKLSNMHPHNNMLVWAHVKAVNALVCHAEINHMQISHKDDKIH